HLPKIAILKATPRAWNMRQSVHEEIHHPIAKALRRCVSPGPSQISDLRLEAFGRLERQYDLHEPEVLAASRRLESSSRVTVSPLAIWSRPRCREASASGGARS